MRYAEFYGSNGFDAMTNANFDWKFQWPNPSDFPSCGGAHVIKCHMQPQVLLTTDDNCSNDDE